ncbi:MAG: ROK family protein [Oscillospiraceae bacterium]
MKTWLRRSAEGATPSIPSESGSVLWRCLFLAEPTIQYIIVNLYGEIVEDGSLPTPTGELEPLLLDFLSGISQNREIRSVCIGVPGIAENDGFSRKSQHDILEKTRLGEGIRSKYGIPVLLENDINAITIGAGRSHINKLPEEFPHLHLAFIHFDTDCISGVFYRTAGLSRVGGILPANWAFYRRAAAGICAKSCRRSLVSSNLRMRPPLLWRKSDVS